MHPFTKAAKAAKAAKALRAEKAAAKAARAAARDLARTQAAEAEARAQASLAYEQSIAALLECTTRLSKATGHAPSDVLAAMQVVEARRTATAAEVGTNQLREKVADVEFAIKQLPQRQSY